MQRPNWWQEAVVYQIYPRSFQSTTGKGIGDLNGITLRLDYLKTLGIGVIWLSPVYQSPQKDNGYDISDYRAIAEEFGTMADFERLLSEAHARGIRVVMDLVVNHTSDQHAWFIEARAGRQSAKRDWYIWRDGQADGPPNGLQSVFSGPAWQRDEASGQYYLHLFVKEQPDLNWENPAVRDEVYEMMGWWLDKGIDGFRMDVINLIAKPEAALEPGGLAATIGDIANGPRVHEYLREMNQRVLSRYDIMTVGETPGATVESARRYANMDGTELNMVFHFELMDVDGDPRLGRWSTRRAKLADIKRVLGKWQEGLAGVAWNSLYWNNHDQPRVVSRFGNDRNRLVWEKSAKMLATCLHLMQGTPYIYQGEELGMTNAALQTLADCRDVETFNAYRELVEEQQLCTPEEMLAMIRCRSRDNARTPMQWSAAPNAGFSVETPWLAVNPNYPWLNAAAQVADPNSIFHYYRRLVALRKQQPLVIQGRYRLLRGEDEQVYAYERVGEDGRLLVICNFSEEALDEAPYEALRAPGDALLIGNYAAAERRAGLLLPYEARVYR